MKKEICEHPIQVKETTLNRLKKLRIVERESLNDVIERLLKKVE